MNAHSQGGASHPGHEGGARARADESGAAEPGGTEQLLREVYGELQRLAGAYMRRERASHSLEPVELVHEAYMRLKRSSTLHHADRTHFHALAATAMRRLLVDHARRKRSSQRGGDWHRVSFSERLGEGGGFEADLLDLDRALDELASLDERQARIVELKYLAGLTTTEIAEFLAMSPTNVKKQWTFAKAWLRTRLRIA